MKTLYVGAECAGHVAARVVDEDTLRDKTDEDAWAEGDRGDYREWGTGDDGELAAQARAELGMSYDDRAGGAGDAYRHRCARNVLRYLSGADAV